MRSSRALTDQKVATTFTALLRLPPAAALIDGQEVRKRGLMFRILMEAVAGRGCHTYYILLLTSERRERILKVKGRDDFVSEEQGTELFPLTVSLCLLFADLRSPLTSRRLCLLLLSTSRCCTFFSRIPLRAAHQVSRSFPCFSFHLTLGLIVSGKVVARSPVCLVGFCPFVFERENWLLTSGCT